MTQASDLGAIANQLAAFYRARVNANIQALATQHYGATEPPVMYPNMLWFDSGTGYVKLRDPTNTSWWTVGTIGPPMKWTNVDIPQTAFTTGDVKQTFKTVADAGWVMMNDGSIGDGSSGAMTRANPDTQALFTLLWNNIGDAYCIALRRRHQYARPAAAPRRRPTGRRTGTSPCPRCSAGCWRPPDGAPDCPTSPSASYWGEECARARRSTRCRRTRTRFAVPAHTHTVPGSERWCGRRIRRRSDLSAVGRRRRHQLRRRRLSSATPARPVAARRTSTFSRRPTSTS